MKMEKEKSFWAEWASHLSSLIRESEGLDSDMKLISNSINRLKNTVTELEIMAKRINIIAEQFQIKINHLMQNFMNQIEKESNQNLTKKNIQNQEMDKPAPSTPKVKEPSKKPEREMVVIKNNEPKISAVEPPGVMIFLTPDIDEDNKLELGESTCSPRRQLVPTVEEEKMILDYMIRCNHKPNQKDYNLLYKEICSMLLNAPKNAIAIEIKTAPGQRGKKFIEVFYHIKVKNSLDFACIKYIEIEGTAKRA